MSASPAARVDRGLDIGVTVTYNKGAANAE
jgi:hypothetical protein